MNLFQIKIAEALELLVTENDERDARITAIEAAIRELTTKPLPVPTPTPTPVPTGSIDPRKYGAKFDGVTDDTAALRAAINTAPLGGTIACPVGAVAKVSGRIDLIGRTLHGLHALFVSPQATIVMIGQSPKLLQSRISVGNTFPVFSAALSGAINLHLSDGALIEGLVIPDGISNRTGIHCSTKASNTTIRQCRLDYIGWPILFNDMSGPASRTIDGVDYSAESMGSGLLVEDCYLGAADKTAVGDACNVNAPIRRFSNFKVQRCTVLKSVATGGNGLGLGAADTDGVEIVDNIVRDIAHDGLHAEYCTDAVIARNVAERCNRGVSMQGTIRGTIDKNIIKDSVAFSIASQGQTKINQGIMIARNTISGCQGWADICMGNSDNIVIDNNEFAGVGAPGCVWINLLTYAGKGATNVTVAGNKFSGALPTNGFYASPESRPVIIGQGNIIPTARAGQLANFARA